MQLELNGYYLRSLDVEDKGVFYKWSLDREVTFYSLSSYAYPQSKSEIEKWLLNIKPAACVLSAFWKTIVW